MIGFEIVDGKIEISGFEENDSLTLLYQEAERFRREPGLVTTTCEGCGGCCNQPIPVLGFDIAGLAVATGAAREELLDRYLVLPEIPLPEERREGIESFILEHGLSREAAEYLYEYNRAEPVILSRKPDDTCVFLENGLCTIYGNRPFICRLYTCIMGDRLSVLSENIVRQGTWHAYAILDRFPAGEIVRNPFFSGRGYDEIGLAAFDREMHEAIEKLFFYF